MQLNSTIAFSVKNRNDVLTLKILYSTKNYSQFRFADKLLNSRTVVVDGDVHFPLTYNCRMVALSTPCLFALASCGRRRAGKQPRQHRGTFDWVADEANAQLYRVCQDSTRSRREAKQLELQNALNDGYLLRPDDFGMHFRGPCTPELSTDPRTCGLDSPPEAYDPVFSAKLAKVKPTKKHERLEIVTKATSVREQLAARTAAIHAAASAAAARAHASGDALIENADGTFSSWRGGVGTLLEPSSPDIIIID